MAAELETVWEPEALQDRLHEAVLMVAGINPPPDLRVPLFNLAAQALLLQMPKQQPGAAAIAGLTGLGSVRGH